MRNPFYEFHPERYHPRSTEIDTRIQKRRSTLSFLLDGYADIIEKQIGELAWIVEHERVVKTWRQSLKIVSGITCNIYDLEQFCFELERENVFPGMIPGPAGIFVSAMINRIGQNRIELNVNEFKRRFHFLGYSLPPEKTLVLRGNTGDFTGSGLKGGKLIVEGNTGAWCGAGMIDGNIHISGDAGNYTGEWMHGGTIRVDGQMASIGSNRYGGNVAGK
jgi:hypothetical protein